MILITKTKETITISNLPFNLPDKTYLRTKHNIYCHPYGFSVEKDGDYRSTFLYAGPFIMIDESENSGTE